MKIVTHVWAAVVLTLLPMSGAVLFRITDGHNKRHYYGRKGLTELNQEISADLERHAVWASMTDSELRGMAASLLRLIPKIPFRPAGLDGIPMADMTLSTLTIPIGDFRVRRVSLPNIPNEASIDLSFTVPKVLVTFSSNNCQRNRESRVPCTIQHTFEEVSVDLRTTYRPSPPRNIIGASILKAEPGSMTTQSSLGHTTYPSGQVTRQSPLWTSMMKLARLYIESIPNKNQFRILLKTFAENFFN